MHASCAGYALPFQGLILLGYILQVSNMSMLQVCTDNAKTVRVHAVRLNLQIVVYIGS